MFTRRLLLAFLTTTALLAQSKVESINQDRNGVAIEGYDAVTYFTDGKPLKGDRKLSYQWEGAIWLFATPAHRDEFASSPAKYAPQYGGYCAYAVSEGYTAKIDPEAWKLVDGKLYLNYSKSVRDKWQKDQARRISTADKNWPLLHR
jgi:YHS domain-containing protein